MKNRCAGLVVLPVPETNMGTYHKGTCPKPNEVRSQKQDVRGQKSPISGLLNSAFSTLSSAFGWGILPRYLGGSIPGLVMFSLFAFGVANADIEFGAVLDPGVYVIRVDSVSITPPDTTFLTTGWGADTPYDTFVFAGVPAWPETLRLHGNLIGPFHLTYLYPDTGRWYHIGSSGRGPFVKFYGDYGGVEESKPTVAPLRHLAVNPSVVRGQMRIRLQPVGTSRPVVWIHDAAGNVVRSLDCSAGDDGAATATWNREDEFGRPVPEGVYFCRYAAADVITVRKVIVAH